MKSFLHNVSPAKQQLRRLRKANQALSECTSVHSSGDVSELRTNLQYTHRDADKLRTTQAVCYQLSVCCTSTMNITTTTVSKPETSLQHNRIVISGLLGSEAEGPVTAL